ncbi:hypothetical protein BDU57DRAFT_555353 [Ampelomyces quisqualis]|uniref:NAD(P)-binding protein n=1 Tax=Ampelomyces quisqualis TaxID=50730 RepID=A0A6A5QSH2_AMPQU|nr:hypothetical protein BDU57DRAFT_555353 [Ampelomyces quisqualis]
MASALGLSSNTFDPDKDIPDLDGKVYVVTGGSAGIGYGIVAHLCNLEDLKQTDEVAKQLAQKLTRLDALVCNAGLGVGIYNETRDGIDSHMQVNVFAQAHLTLMLLPVLQKTTDSRIVHQSSYLHKGATTSMKLESLHEMNQDICAMLLYNRTKLAQILFLRQLYSRIKATQFGTVTGNTGLPWINTTHPGGIKTDQQAQAVEAYGSLGKIGVAVARPFLKDPVSQGCRSALFAATSPDIATEQVQNSLIVPDRKVVEPSKQALDKTLSQNLWNLTKQVLESKIGNLPCTT